MDISVFICRCWHRGSRAFSMLGFRVGGKNDIPGGRGGGGGEEKGRGRRREPVVS